MTLLSRLLLSLLLSGVCAVQADKHPNTTPDEALNKAEPWYQVEVLIFAQTDNFGDENASAVERLYYPTPLIELEGSDSPFPVLDKSAQQLGPEAYTLGRSDRYRVLYHQVWQQPGRNSANAPWLRISGGDTHGQHRELEGSLRIYLSRFLHLETNLWKIVFGSPSPSSNSAKPNGDRTKSTASSSTALSDVALDDPGLSSREQNTNLLTLPGIPGSLHTVPETLVAGSAFTMRESRQLELGELYYLDHANMGLLIKVNRAQR